MNADLIVRNVAAHWIQAGVLATSALIAIRLMNVNMPRARLAAFHSALIAIVLLPLMQPWRTDEPDRQVASSAIAVDAAAVISETAVAIEPGAAGRLDPAGSVVVTLAIGIVLRLLWLWYGVIRLARFSGTAATVPPPAVAGALEAQLTVSPRYIQQTGSRGPWTFGFVRPTIALPVGFDALPPAFQRSVICHELVHVKRRDMALAFTEELAVAALWFHPWIWLLRARIRVAREQVVDSQVVAMLGNRDEYVRCLVDISGHDLAPHFVQAGAGMLRPRELRARVDAIFQEAHMSRLRFTVAALAFLAVTVGTGLIATAAMPLRSASTVSASNEPLPLLVSRFLITEASATAIGWTAGEQPQLAHSQAVQDTPRRQVNRAYPEYPQDALERGIRGTVVVDITVNAAGDVTTAAVASGPQELRASALKGVLGLKYTPGSSTTAMKVGVEYTLAGSSWGVRIGSATASGSLGSAATGSSVWSSRGPENPMPPALRVGGNIRPPKKIKDRPPVYPAEAQEARVQGVVILEARVDENGDVSHTHVLRSVPLLDQAAIDAVKQWQYTPTLMNGAAVPVMMTVTVNFTLRSEVQLRINMPDGTLVLLRTSPNGGIGRTEHPAMSRFGFAPFLDPDPSAETVNVTIYEFDDNGNPPRQLGEVQLSPGAGLVQSATTPSFGIELVNVSR